MSKEFGYWELSFIKANIVFAIEFNFLVIYCAQILKCNQI